MSRDKKRSVVRRDHPDLSISQQCKLMQLIQSAFYDTTVGIDAATLEMMKAIDRPNQTRCAGITFVPVKNGDLYLVSIMDWATRKVLSWRLSNTMHADFCVEALSEAIAKNGPPEIMNTLSWFAIKPLPGSGSGFAVHGQRVNRDINRGRRAHFNATR